MDHHIKGSQIGVVFNQANLLHKSSRKHPESPERLLPILEALPELAKKIPNIKLQQIGSEAGQLKREQVQAMIADQHGENYWQFVKEMWHEGIKKPEMYINQDTYFMKDTYFAALEAARSTVQGTNILLKSQNQAACLALVRPPGHHSGMKNQPHGFSFFNNLALAVNYALNSKIIKKAAIIDWDVHHGEGTQKLFYNRKDVLFVSMHRFDDGKFFPHIKESSSENVGSGTGQGFNVNICWNLPQKNKGETFERQETCGDEEYAYAFETIILPILRQYDPDMIFVSCGFDSAFGDPIGGLLLTEAGYAYMTKKLMEFKKKMLLVLEGGYNPDVLLWASQSVLEALSCCSPEATSVEVDNLIKKEYEPSKVGKQGVQTALKSIQKFWNSF